MPDDQPFYAPGRKPSPPRERTPGQVIWTLKRGAERRTCEFRVSPGYRIECQVFADGEILFGQRFATRDDLVKRQLESADRNRDGAHPTDWIHTVRYHLCFLGEFP